MFWEFQQTSSLYWNSKALVCTDQFSLDSSFSLNIWKYIDIINSFCLFFWLCLFFCSEYIAYLLDIGFQLKYKSERKVVRITLTTTVIMPLPFSVFRTNSCFKDIRFNVFLLICSHLTIDCVITMLKTREKKMSFRFYLSLRVELVRELRGVGIHET